MRYLAALLLAGCATTLDYGVESYQAGRYIEAARHFQSCAAEGNPNCMHNIGVLYQNRNIASVDPRNDAIKWYMLAARHGNAGSRTALVNMNAPVPPADLAPLPAQATPEEYEAAAALGAAIGTAMGGHRRK